ncbi:YadA family autotransporter adhesin [Paraburkholderia bengalensis]
MSATPAWAASIANSSCSPDGPGSGTWSNVAGCWANAGAAGALHNLGETVIGSYGYVPTNVSFATIFGFAGQSNALYGTSLGANGVVASGAQNSVALGAGSVATESNTVSVGRVGNNPLYNVHTSGDSTGADSAPMNQSLLGTVNRRVTNMAAGINDTDAANVSQVKGVTSALGGGAGVNSDGSVKKPTYVVQGASVSDIGSALSKLDSVVSNVNNGAGIKYFHATSTLADSVVGGANSIAIGGAAVTGAAANAIAIGANASAQGANYYDGSYSVAIGSGARADSTAGNWGHDTAIGGNANASTTNGTAVGYGATASGITASAVGFTATAGGGYANAVGYQTNAAGQDSVAIGTQANVAATASQSVALGARATASAINSVALGTNSTTTANLGAAAYNPGSAALSGTASVANGEVSVGKAGAERRVTNVAAGSAATDAVNVSQLQSEDAKVNGVSNSVANLSNTVNNFAGSVTNINNISTSVTNIVNGGGIKYFHANSTRADSVASATDAVAIGGNATASGNWSQAVGELTTASGTSSLAMGDATISTGAASVALGAHATAAGAAGIAIGQNAQNLAGANNSLALGGDAAAGDKAVAIGNGSKAAGTWAVAAGVNSQAAGAQGSAFGNSASASGSLATALGTGAAATTANSVAIGAYSTTTANLSAAAYNPGSAALSGTASVANGEVSMGKSGAERRVTNVAAGSAATDAVNVSQLQSEDAKVSAFGNNVSNLSNTVNNYAGSITNINTSVTNIVNGGGIKYFHANSTRTDSVASGTALTMIPDVDQGKTVAVGVGAGTYQGYQAAALGASARVTENIKVKLGAGISAQGTTFGAGASYQW